VRAQHIGEAVRQLRALDPAVFDERPQGLWDLLQQAVAGRRMGLVAHMYDLFPLARQWPGYTVALYNYIDNPGVSAALVRALLGCGVPCTEYSWRWADLIQSMIVAHAAAPARLLEKLQLVFESHRELGLDFGKHVRNSVDTFAQTSRGFSDEHFLAGFGLLLKYAELLGADGPRRGIMHDSMVSDAAEWNDARLLAYLCETHKLNIHKVSRRNRNAYSCTSSPAVVRYLRVKNVSPHLIDTDGDTPLTALLLRVLKGDTALDVRDVYACVELYFSFGLHIVPPDMLRRGSSSPRVLEGDFKLVAPPDAPESRQGRRMRRAFAPDDAAAASVYFDRPLSMASAAAERNPAYQELLALVSYVHTNNSLPRPAGPQMRAASTAAPRPEARAPLALAAQHIAGAPRAVRRLPAPPALSARRDWQLRPALQK